MAPDYTFHNSDFSLLNPWKIPINSYKVKYYHNSVTSNFFNSIKINNSTILIGSKNVDLQFLIKILWIKNWLKISHNTIENSNILNNEKNPSKIMKTFCVGMPTKNYVLKKRIWSLKRKHEMNNFIFRQLKKSITKTCIYYI